MKVFFSAWITVFVILLSMLSCSEKGDNNPAGPGDETYTISGNVIDVNEGDGMADVSINITGTTIQETIITDKYGEFSLSNLSRGSYTITPINEEYKFGPKEINISVENDDYDVEEFLAVKMDEDQYTIAGNIVDIAGRDGKPVFVYLHVVNSKRDSVLTFTNKGYYGAKYYQGGKIVWPFIKGETYQIIPGDNDNDYIFSPDTCYVTVYENVTICNFSAENIAPPVYTITGRVTDFEGTGLSEINVLLIWLKNDFTYLETYQTDENGHYEFTGLEDGTYSLKLYSNDYVFVQDTTDVTIEGNDVTVQDIQALNDYTYYSVSGKVVDSHGTGLPDVPISVYKAGMYINYYEQEITTGSDGVFMCEVSVKREVVENTYIFIPTKIGYLFTPDTTYVTLSWVEMKGNLDDVVLPDFTVDDYSVFTASDYFPLSIGSTWTYTRTENDKKPYDHSVNVTGTVSHDGQIYHRLSEPGPWNFTDFRIEDNSVYAFSDNDDVLFLKFGVVPGTRWDSGVIAGTYTRKGAFIGTETVETPTGIFENCVHIEIKVVYGETSFDSYDLWYALGVGLVKSVKIVENYGRRLEYVVDELKEYEMP